MNDTEFLSEERKHAVRKYEDLSWAVLGRMIRTSKAFWGRVEWKVDLKDQPSEDEMERRKNKCTTQRYS